MGLGCGSGFGTQPILQRFGAAQVDAVDLNPAMIARARRRLAPYGRVRLPEGSATDLRSALDAEYSSYEAISTSPLSTTSRTGGPAEARR